MSLQMPSTSPVSMHELLAYRDIVIWNLGMADNALSVLSRDIGNRTLVDSVFRGLITVRNLTGYLGMEAVKEYAEKAVGMVRDAMQFAEDFTSLVERLPQEISYLAEVATENFDTLSNTLDSFGNRADALRDMAAPSTGMTTYNPALDRSVESAIARTGVGSFGSVAFQVSEEILALVSGVQRKTAIRVEEHQVVGEKPRLEFLSPELDETTFSVFWHRAFGLNPRTEIRKLRELCAAGVAQHLILGGENFGKCLLLDVAEDWGKSGPGGSPLTARASLTFKEYL